MWSLGVIIIAGNFFELSVCLSLPVYLSLSLSCFLSFLSFFSLVFDLDFFFSFFINQEPLGWLVFVWLIDHSSIKGGKTVTWHFLGCCQTEILSYFSQ